jgi:hypothetical protein
LNAAQIDRLTELLKQEYHVKEAKEKSFDSDSGSMASQLWQADATKYRGDNRHVAMLSIMDSLCLNYPNESDEVILAMADAKNKAMCKEVDSDKPAPLSDSELRSILQQARRYAREKGSKKWRWNDNRKGENGSGDGNGGNSSPVLSQLPDYTGITASCSRDIVTYTA